MSIKVDGTSDQQSDTKHIWQEYVNARGLINLNSPGPDGKLVVGGMYRLLFCPKWMDR